MGAFDWIGRIFSEIRGEGPHYRRLVAWVETNTPARFDGSQSAADVRKHIQEKITELRQHRRSRELRGLQKFIESQRYEKLIRK